MCGFAGWIGERDDHLLERMIRVQRHRGPDADGYVYDEVDRVAAGSCRLEILDAAGGIQPRVDATSATTLVYAGEIVNAPTLRAALESRGHAFRSDRSDTEVVQRAYAEFGVDMLAHLNGMYSFVIHDRRRHLLFGAVDRFAIKPLYISEGGPTFAFATELKSLLALPSVDKRLDRQAFSDALTFQCVPAPRSIVRGIRKLGAGEMFTVDLRTNRLVVRSYWRPAIADTGTSSSPPTNVSAAARDCRTLLNEALHRWRHSDRPLGFALSGGIDSSALVALAAGRERGATPLRTYFTMLEGETSDAQERARTVARLVGAEHREIVVEPAAVAAAIDAIVHHLDEPYGGSIPSWFLYRSMAEDVRVAITGIGADELFGNYGKWRDEPLPGDDSAAARARQRAIAIARRRQGRFRDEYLSDAFKREVLFAPGFAEELEASEPIHDALRLASGARDPRSRIAYVDSRLQLPCEFLQMTDRLSMAHGLEARPPFLDRDLVDFVWALPPEVRSPGSSPKALLAAAVAPFLPESLLRAPKQPFAFPRERLLRGVLAERVADLFAPDRLRRQGIWRNDLRETLVRPFTAGRREGTQAIWSVLLAQIWLDQALGSGVTAG